ncbi:hypothetical protein I6G80_24530 (plasmid) [Bacillus licheniformis]|uniref:Uncharacterized protein n=1 Tax=Bacillus licheniformis TaxID=1402 RepID=A0AB37H066_BACLI|nr:hypothetical protein [Bacillus licheniformis]QPR70604.1 hypothetical protein I6G80_00505 [Bacillus licheniformis]QPR75176.1 hypothetical protein I6G80_24530 [Bacillus licheniformis]
MLIIALARGCASEQQRKNRGSQSGVPDLFKELEKYKDIHLEMYPQYVDLEQRFGALEKDFHPSTLEIGRYYNREAMKLLNQELGRVTQPDFILGVRLKGNLLEGSEDIKGLSKTLLRRFRTFW